MAANLTKGSVDIVKDLGGKAGMWKSASNLDQVLHARTDERTNGRTDGRTNGRMDTWKDARMQGRTDEGMTHALM